MAVETRVIIDANASNAIKEIGKLDQAAQDADTTIKTLDDQDVNVEVNADGMDELRRKGEEAIAQVKALSDERVDIDVDVDTGNLDKVKNATDEVGSSGRAASTAIGGIGNTVSELPGVGALGPMAETMGQLTEGALEGEVALGELAATAGGLALVALAAKGIQGHFEKIAKTKAFREDQVKKWADALRDGQTLLQGINDELAKTGSLEFQGWDGVADIVPILADAGLKVNDWTAAVQGNAAAQKEFLETVQASGVSHGQLLDITVALKTESENYAAAQERQNDVAAVSVGLTDEQTRAIDGAWSALTKMPGALGSTSDKTQALAAKYRDAADAAAELTYKNSVLRGDIDKADAYIHLQGTLDDLKVKGMETWDAVARGTDDAEQKMRDYQQAQNAAKNEVIDFNEAWGQVDFDKTVNMTTRIDRGEFDALNNDLAVVTSKTQLVDVRIRTTVDNAWNTVMNRLTGTRT